MSVTTLERVKVKRGETFTEKLRAELRAGYHVNSNTPADEYLIPIRLTWSKGAAEAEQVIYPKPQMESLPFSEKPVSVFSGVFEIATRFKASPSAGPGMSTMSGKLRYQACNNKECLPPRTVEVSFPIDLQ